MGVHDPVHQLRRGYVSELVATQVAIADCTSAFSKSTGTFLPQIVARLGYSTIKTNLYTVAPNLVGCVFTLLMTWSSDYFQERTYHLCTGLSFTMVGYLMLAGLDPLKSTGPSYAGSFFLSMGTYIPSCLIHSWHNNIKTDENSRGTKSSIIKD